MPQTHLERKQKRIEKKFWVFSEDNVNLKRLSLELNLTQTEVVRKGIALLSSEHLVKG